MDPDGVGRAIGEGIVLVVVSAAFGFVGLGLLIGWAVAWLVGGGQDD